MNFSEKLSTLRDILGLKQDQMGAKLGVSRNLVSMMERETNPRPPSRAVSLNFGHVVKEAFRDGRISASQVSRLTGEIPIESELTGSVQEAPAGYNGARARLKHAREAKGLSLKQFCKETGYSELIYKGIEDGCSNMSRKMAERVSRVLDIPIEELLDGSDHPTSGNGHHGTVGETPDLVMPPGQKARFVPLLSMAQCGRMMAYDDSAYDHSGFLALNPKDGQAFAVTLAGDSMLPEIRPGDTAIIYPSLPPRNGGIVIARLSEEHGGDVMLKLYQQSGENITLSSYNPAFPPMQFRRDAFAWIYPVAGVHRVF